MFSNVGLDIFIGLIFIFLIYSLLATIIQEIIANNLSFRAKVLEKAILRMLEDGKTTSDNILKDRLLAFRHMFGRPNLLKGKIAAPWFYAHPLIQYLGEDNYYSKPAYITPQNFSKVMIDLLQGLEPGKTGSNVQNIYDSISKGRIYKLPICLDEKSNNRVVKVIRAAEAVAKAKAKNAQKAGTPATVEINKDTALFLKSIWNESNGDLEKFKAKLEQWFNDTMDRATGWYKRYTQFILLLIGLVIAITFNADAVAIYKILSKDKGAREQLVQMAISSKDKYAAILNQVDTSKKIREAYADSLLKMQDSILKKTYQAVADDASAVNQILGLGKPWKDSCKMWKDSIESGFYKRYHDVSFTLLLPGAKRKKARLLELEIDSMMQKMQAAKRVPAELGKTDTALRLAQRQLAAINKWTIDTASALASLKRMDSSSQRFVYLRQHDGFLRFGPKQTNGLSVILGWFLTALAVSLGAPFWFDLLNKVIKLRTSGTKVATPDPSTSVGNDPAAPLSTSLSINLNNKTSEEAVG